MLNKQVKVKNQKLQRILDGITPPIIIAAVVVAVVLLWAALKF